MAAGGRLIPSQSGVDPGSKAGNEGRRSRDGRKRPESLSRGAKIKPAPSVAGPPAESSVDAPPLVAPWLNGSGAGGSGSSGESGAPLSVATCAAAKSARCSGAGRGEVVALGAAGVAAARTDPAEALALGPAVWPQVPAGFQSSAVWPRPSFVHSFAPWRGTPFAVTGRGRVTATAGRGTAWPLTAGPLTAGLAAGATRATVAATAGLGRTGGR
jgi:hypothetical protein